MARKKSRKIGKIGIPKANSPRPTKTEEKSRTKTKRGNKSGTRQQIAEQHLESTRKEKKDPKVGSKKLIDLNKYLPSAKKTKIAKGESTSAIVYRTPQEELEAIEGNTRLDALLEKQSSQKLNAEEQAFVETLSARYSELCQLLGIEVDVEDEDDNHSISLEDDPLAALDAIKLDDFKD